MHAEDNYIDINRQSWNNRVETHLKSEFYDQNSFLKGKTSLKDIELGLLGDVKNKKILHLQCHFGQDTISLSRLGAQVTGVDLSDKAIRTAREVAAQTQSDARFICCDIYELPKHSQEQFDIVFTSYGTIGWLPDLDKWANVIAQFLKPGGQFIFVEFHPMVWMFDDQFEKIAYSYFNTGGIVETESGTYADREADISQAYVSWNHSLSEVISSLVQNGLDIRHFREYDYSPYNCFSKAIEVEAGKYRIEPFGSKIPMLYSVSAQKKTGASQ